MSNKLFSAEEAYEKTLQVDKESCKNLKHIRKTIKKSIKKNRLFCFIDKIDDTNFDLLKILGYTIKKSGWCFQISWSKTDVNVDYVFDGDEFIKAKVDYVVHENEFINKLIEKYPETIFYVKDSKNKFISGFPVNPNYVVVYEAGVRGPADWFTQNQEGLWFHGGYTGYSTKYNDEEFEEMVETIHKHNLAWQQN